MWALIPRGSSPQGCPGRAIAELDGYNLMLAVLKTAANLEVLAERGRFGAAVSDGLCWYEVGN